MTLHIPADFADILGRALDRIDPPKNDTKPWVCDRPDCDGLEHDGANYRHARTAQRPPAGDWLIHLISAGRGWGKSRVGAEWLVEQVLDRPTAPDGAPTEWAIVAETFADARNICVEGPSGIRSVLKRRDIAYTYNRSLWQVRFATGQVIHMLGADDADVGRGLNLSGAWLDELAKWRQARASWTEGLAPALRIGRPQVIVTTTPKPSSLLKDWMSRSDGSVVVTRGSTFDNAANLSPAALEELRRRYEGTRIGRQELLGEYLDDTPGALWQRAQIDADRRDRRDVPELSRVVVAIDPAVTSGEDSDLTGIVVAGRDFNGHFWVLADRSLRATPDGWARVAVDLYREFKADRVVGEVNNGGEMIRATLEHVDRSIPFKAVTATRGKRLRAEPISALYEQCIVGGTPVRTARGEVPIDEVRAGDQVWTRDGLRQVFWSGQTGHASTVAITTTSGHRLECTPEHRVWVVGKGWVHAEDLAPTDRMLMWENATGNASTAAHELAASGAGHALLAIGGRRPESHFESSASTAGFGTTRTSTATGVAVVTLATSCCIELSTSTSVAPSRMGGTCITGTATRETTRSRTLRRCRATSTATGPMVSGLPTPMRLVTCSPAPSWNGGRTGSLAHWSAACAEASTARSRRAPASALRPATRATGISSVEQRPGERPVYDLTVEGLPEFFASDLLVHNSRVHHAGAFPELEDQLCTWTADADYSPDRLDSCVWALTDLADIAGINYYMNELLRAEQTTSTAAPGGEKPAAVGINTLMAELTRGQK